MKKVSAKLFFTVLWRGLCGALRWFIGLFGYKRDGKFAKCTWGLFATSAAVVMTVFAVGLLWAIGDNYYRYYKRQHKTCNFGDCYHSEYISRDIYFHNTHDTEGFIFNRNTKEKLVEHVQWIAEPLGDDSLVCFSNGKKRGYFSRNTGRVVIEPKYDHAWVFSEGLASVDENGGIKMIDSTGKVVVDLKIPYFYNREGCVFHGGYCVVKDDNDKLCGLMDKSGRMVLPREYESITPSEDCELWQVKKGEMMAVYDKNLRMVIPLTECVIYIGNGTIDMTMPDHTMRKYDMEGNLIHDFYITGIRTLEYEKDEFKYDVAEFGDFDNTELKVAGYHPCAIARLRAYVAGDGYEGLMTADGHMVTKPLYRDINAIGDDLYLCEVSNGDKVIIDGKGNIVK